MLHGPKRRNVDDILHYTAVDPKQDHWAGDDIEPGIEGYHRPDGSHEQDTETGMSLLQFCTYFKNLPQEQRRRALLTGLKSDGSPLIMNWLKDSLVLQREWLVPAIDIDSVSYTGRSPKFLKLVNITPWPDRARTLTTNNKLSIHHDGAIRPLSHSSVQNFCMAVLGNNGQFRLNVFLPKLDVERAANKRPKTYVTKPVMALWYDEVFLGALKSLSKTLPDNLIPAYLQIMQELPDCYETAEKHSIGAGQQGKVSKGYPIIPELLNLVIPVMRDMVHSQDRFLHLRGFFFHLFGMNLKTSAQSLSGQAGNNLVKHTLDVHSYIDFNSVNPADLVFDFGVEIMVDHSKLPDELQHITLLWNRPVATPLIMPNWRKPTVDAYCSSSVIGGWRGQSSQTPFNSGLFGGQAYLKDKNQTRVHQDRSLGAQFTPGDAIENGNRFKTDMKHLKDVWAVIWSYGVRFEYRAIAWVAMLLQQVPHERWLDTLFHGNALVAHPSALVARTKETFRSIYVDIIEVVQALPPAVRSQSDTRTLVVAVSYMIKALVKRPDDQSSSRKVVAALNMGTRAAHYGFPSVHPECLSADLTRIDLDKVPQEALVILDYFYRKGPAGARVKTSKVKNPLPPRQQPTANDSDSDLSAMQIAPVDNWTKEDQEWVKHFINHRFALHLWTIFPGRRTQVSHSLLEQPFTNNTWGQIVKPGIQKNPLVRGVNTFTAKVQEFFPHNWLTTRQHSVWQTYQTAVLKVLQDRAKTRAQGDVQGYNTKMREAIVQELEHWHFLPCSQNKLIWSYDGTGANRVYRVVANPNVTFKETM
ncbi:Cell wall alpha-1,3-glucan synthase ags1 [Rhizoctonia solani]|uniref:Cell wall alpha-1,3-glucan synthase ags1 n=1 Tax=Rhizoctonia solani TaxID=456999 RepID=A0A0K6GDR2_9AGAM|nr:Cell wall alpha-1,3-glucan synthase ags1 [Rhizoctonia solani]